MDPTKWIPFFEGHRTHLVALLAIVYVGGCEWLDKTPSETVLSILAFLGLSFLRSGINKINPPNPPQP